MLLRIDPTLNADVLYVLRAMGHGDDLVICDTNFPADSVAQQTVHGRLLRMENLTAARAVRAVLSVMPLDSFVEHPAERMEVAGESQARFPRFSWRCRPRLMPPPNKMRGARAGPWTS